MANKSQHAARSSGPVDIHVGSVLRQLRLGAEYSQARLAEMIGVSLGQIQKYETGTNRIGASRLFALSQIFMVSTDKFFEGLFDVPANNEKPLLSTQFFEHPRATKLATAFLKIKNPKWENDIIALCRSLSNFSEKT